MLRPPARPVTAAGPAATSRQPLDAATLQQVRGVGQALLVAKKSQATADPDMAALKQKVEDLRNVITTLQSPSLRSGKMPQVSVSAGNSVDSPSSLQQDQQKRQQQADNRLRAALEAMRKQRFVVQQGAPQNA